MGTTNTKPCDCCGADFAPHTSPFAAYGMCDDCADDYCEHHPSEAAALDAARDELGPTAGDCPVSRDATNTPEAA